MPIIKANGIEICYETIGNKEHPAILLFGGLGWQLVSWGDAFCEELASSGFFVVRFDSRDAGLSTWFSESGVPDIAAMFKDVQAGETPKAPYSIDDMADDAIALMDQLGLNNAHVCGTSMGGIIAQAMAINHPERVLSLTCIGTTTGNPNLPLATGEAMEVSSAPRVDDREAAAQRAIDLNRVAGSPKYPTDRQVLVDRAYRAYDRAFNVDGISRQVAAVFAHGDRRSKLQNLRVKSLIIHGLADRLVLPADGIDAHENIPGSELLLIEGMGHELPSGVWSQVISAISRLAA